MLDVINNIFILSKHHKNQLWTPEEKGNFKIWYLSPQINYNAKENVSSQLPIYFGHPWNSSNSWKRPILALYIAIYDKLKWPLMAIL